MELGRGQPPRFVRGCSGAAEWKHGREAHGLEQEAPLRTRSQKRQEALPDGCSSPRRRTGAPEAVGKDCGIQSMLCEESLLAQVVDISAKGPLGAGLAKIRGACEGEERKGGHDVFYRSATWLGSGARAQARMKFSLRQGGICFQPLAASSLRRGSQKQRLPACS